MDKKTASYLVLSHVRWFRWAHLKALQAAFGGTEDIVDADLSKLASFGELGPGMREELVACIRNLDPEAVLKNLTDKGVTPVNVEHEAYPEKLKRLADPPLVLFCLGDISLLDKLSIAVVGSRKASRYGLEQAEKLGYDLASLGMVVVSGLALGIDGASHRGALSARGKTIAVLGCGPDVIYPGEHKELYHQIVKEGLVVSEYPLGIEPHAVHFPERNRIISGLSHGVAIAEAARGSGALITARRALDQGREVFAMPGLVTSPYAKGCHHLIKTGQAALIENADDILAGLGLNKQELLFGSASVESGAAGAESAAAGGYLGDSPRGLDKPVYTAHSLSPEEKNVLEHVSYEGTHINELARETKMSIAELSAHLTMLEIRGAVTAASGGYYQRT